MNGRYDAIVLGLGGVGSAALWQLAARGVKALGIDRFAPPHSRGSSHGQTRIIRQAYFEHSDYVPLLLRSYSLWRELEQQSGKQLLTQTGLLQVGTRRGVVVAGVLNAAKLHALNVEELTAAQIEARWPAFRVPRKLAGVFEPQAGYLRVEECVRACLAEALRAGAETALNQEVTAWRVGDGEYGVSVETASATYSARRLIVAAGPWAAQVLASEGLPLTIRRKVVAWHDCRRDDVRAERGFPCFLFELPTGIFYGFPSIDEQGLKVGEHTGGRTIADPLSVDRGLHRDDQVPLESFLHAHIPHAKSPCREHSVCLYTLTPDEHFIVDVAYEGRVAYAAGLSGHGFKFAPVLGEALCDLALKGGTELPLGFLAKNGAASRINKGNDECQIAE